MDDFIQGFLWGIWLGLLTIVNNTLLKYEILSIGIIVLIIQIIHYIVKERRINKQI